MNTRAAPVSEDELMQRARSLSGHTMAEVAALAGRVVPVDLRRAKGFIGHLAEWATGAPGHTRATPDFEALGIELKTIPIDNHAQPRESTFVCTIDLRRIGDTEWSQSALRHKLQRVLWIPIEHAPDKPLAERRFGVPLLWTLQEPEESALRHDWETLVSQLARDDMDRVTAHVGHYLQVRPKAAHSRARRRVVDRDDVPVDALPRGFYLRRAFTARVFCNYAPRSSDAVE